MNLRRWMMITVFFALLMGSERMAGRRACFLGKAKAWASRAHDYSENRGLICLKDESLDRERRSIYLDRMRDSRRSIGTQIPKGGEPSLAYCGP